MTLFKHNEEFDSFDEMQRRIDQRTRRFAWWFGFCAVLALGGLVLVMWIAISMLDKYL